MSTSSSPCAACKLRRQKCAQECIFAPYFPPDQPKKFANVHEVFGASNVAKILNELNPNHREDAVNSLAYEAEARLRDPVYGCVGLISILQHRLKLVQQDLFNAKNELAKYIGPSAMLPIFDPGLIQQHPSSSNSGVLPYNMQQMLGLPGPPHGNQFMIRETQQHQQLAAREEQEMIRRTYEQQHLQQPEVVRFEGDGDGDGGFNGSAVVGQVTASAFSIMTSGDMSPSLALGSYDNSINYHQIQQHSEDHQQLQPQQLLLHEHPLQRAGSEEGRSFHPSL